jgi:four helix bundle protein
MTARRNINRGFRKLEVWQDALELYKMVSKAFMGLPFELKKVASNVIDASHSILRNIAEGYCRRTLREYLQHLNIALGSCGEVHASYTACGEAGQIPAEACEEIDEQHYKVENKLIKLVKSLQEKQRRGEWEESFAEDEDPQNPAEE